LMEINGTTNTTIAPEKLIRSIYITLTIPYAFLVFYVLMILTRIIITKPEYWSVVVFHLVITCSVIIRESALINGAINVSGSEYLENTPGMLFFLATLCGYIIICFGRHMDDITILFAKKILLLIWIFIFIVVIIIYFIFQRLLGNSAVDVLFITFWVFLIVGSFASCIFLKKTVPKFPLLQGDAVKLIILDLCFIVKLISISIALSIGTTINPHNLDQLSKMDVWSVPLMLNYYIVGEFIPACLLLNMIFGDDLKVLVFSMDDFKDKKHDDENTPLCKAQDIIPPHSPIVCQPI